VWIVEVSDMRIVEGNVSVLANANAGDVQRMLPQQACVPRAFRVQILSIAIQVMYVREADFVEYAALKEITKTLRRVVGESNVLIEMEGRYARPINAFRFT